LRTALVQLLADNPDGKLWPGAFTTVHFHIPSDPNVLRVPATALIFGPHGMQVAKVDEENKVVLSKVQLGRNLGNYVELTSGVSLSRRGSTPCRCWRILPADRRGLPEKSFGADPTLL
jgi:membrane fusion protein, multidrug efflux system